MATYTWRGGQGTGNDTNDASAAVNWFTSTGSVASIAPMAGDTMIIPSAAGAPATVDFYSGTMLSGSTVSIGSGDVVNLDTILVDDGSFTVSADSSLNLSDTSLNGGNLTFASGSTLNVSGDTQQTGTLFDQNSGTAYETLDGSAITGGGNILSTGTSFAFNADGNVDIDNSIIATTAGGSVTITANALATADGTVPGALMFTGGVIGVDQTITMNSGSDAAIGNNAQIIDASGRLIINAKQLPVSGAIYLVGSETAEVATGMPGSQTVYFSGPNQVLDIENAATVLPNFGAGLAGFATGDTIELVGLSNLTGTYEDTTLTLLSGTTTVGSLTFPASQALDGTLGSDGFSITSSGGSTFITTVAANDSLNAVTPDGSVDWSTAATWSGGVPGATAVADIALSTTEINEYLSGVQPQYNLVVSTPATVGSVVMSDPLATLDIDSALTLKAPQTGNTGGGAFDAADGTVEISDVGLLSAATYQAPLHSNLQISAGGLMMLSGQTTESAAKGWGAADIENNATIDGTLTAQGFLLVGKDSPQGGSVTLENGGSLSDDYAVLAGGQYGSAFVQVTGEFSTWRDAGDSAHAGDTATYLGDMVIGGGLLSDQGQVKLSTSDPNGSGHLEIDTHGTVIETGSAILGMTGIGAGNTLNSFGQAYLQNDGTWEVGAQLDIGGSPLYAAAGDEGGGGQVDVTSGSQVLLGTAETAGQYKLALGYSVGSVGSLDVNATDSFGVSAAVDVGGGPLVIGEAGSGSLSAEFAGTIDNVAASATAGFPWGVMIGDQAGASGTLALNGGSFSASGDMIVGNNGAGSLEVGSGSFQLDGAMYLGGTETGAGLGDGVANFNNEVQSTIEGNVQVYPGSTLMLGSGGLEIGSAGGAVSFSLTVDSGQTLGVGGTLQLDGLSVFNSGTIVAETAGQTLDIPSNSNVFGSGLFAIDAGAALEVDNNDQSITIAFGTGSDTNGATAILTNIGGTDELQGFYGADRVDLPWLSFAGNAPTVEYAPNLNPLTGGTVNVDYSGGSAVSFTVTGSHPAGFAISPDNGPGTFLYARDSAPPCFAAGTRIATPGGEVAVEGLRVGDAVRLADGGTARIVWLGHRRVDCRRHPRPWDVLPVRVAAGAFGPGQPARDVLLSPDHAVFVDGGLIPVRYLLNGRTVAQEAADSITYWHVELDRHAVLLAEGLPCESYLDTGNRAAFTNGGAALHLHPDFALRVWAAQACAPLVRDGAPLAAARRALLARAAALGHAITAEPALRVLADGRPVRAEIDGRHWHIALPATARTVRLRSRTWVPAHMRAETDTRRLGVALARLWVDGREVALDSPGFAQGWHAPEAGWRWTDGDAALSVAGARQLAFQLALDGSYWRRPAAAVAPPPARRPARRTLAAGSTLC